MSEATGLDASSRQSDERIISDELARTRNRLAVASTKNGESSKRSSVTEENQLESMSDQDESMKYDAVDSRSLSTRAAQDSRGSHRSHRSRGSASFLVSNLALEPVMGMYRGPNSHRETTVRRRDLSGDTKGKLPVWSSDNKRNKVRSGFGLGLGKRRLAIDSSNATGDKADNYSRVGTNAWKDPKRNAPQEQSAPVVTAMTPDFESAQIVNLALNLSESRRNAARRNTSTSLQPTFTSYGDGFAGGSLRQHLQMQRRSSRNVSPKPEMGATASPRIQLSPRMDSTVQGTFRTGVGTDYLYHFSTSTIARAEKAKEAIELMAQYRRLLQYVPPLKPQSVARTSTRSPPSTAIGSPPTFAAPQNEDASFSNARRQLGRPYNPLQYIRNQKVRARERQTIDGESQGFGNLQRVTCWIDQVSKDSTRDDYQNNDRVQLPDFSASHDALAPSASSPPSTPSRNSATVSKYKRPRVGWTISPADMLADVYWLEQGDHKNLIEDNRERKMFHQYVDFSRPLGSKDGEPLVEQDSGTKDVNKRLRIDTKIPSISSMRQTADRHMDNTRGRYRQKHNTSQFPEDSYRLDYKNRVRKSSNRSSSESSESDRMQRRPRLRRNATAGSNELATNILEKQMLEMIAKESSSHGGDAWQNEAVKLVPHSPISWSIGGEKGVGKTDHEGSGNEKAASIAASHDDHYKRKNSSRGRAALPNLRSLEVPDLGGRHSFDDFDSSAPNSPVARALSEFGYIPSIAVDLSPTPSRKSSPTRHLTPTKVKLKINSIQDRNKNHSRSNSVLSASRNSEDIEKSSNILEVPSPPDDSRRPASPTTRFLHRKPEESVQPSMKSASLRRKPEELPAGIRGLFKTGRNPVQRLSDLIYMKENQASSMASSNTSSNNSDLEDGKNFAGTRITAEKDSRQSSRDVSTEFSPPEERKPYELPTFSSPMKRGPKSAGPNRDTESPESDFINHHQQVRDSRLSRFQMLQPPRIDVQSASPHSSPDIAPDRTGRDSEVSDLESCRRNSLSVKKADARLNAILGMPGHPRAISGRDGFPVTGLTRLEDDRREGLAKYRQWSISGCSISPSGLITKRDIARVRTLLLSSGVKAKEITRRAGEIQDPSDINKRNTTYAEIASLNREPQLLKPVPRAHAHILAARIVSNDIQLSSQIWQESASNFSSQTVGRILERVDDLQDRILGRNGLSEMTREAEREADIVSQDLLEGKTKGVKDLLERMDIMIRRRRRRFRWMRRAGWVAVEWVLVGVMWWVWLVVVLIRFVIGTVGATIRAMRWLLWL